MQKEKKMYEENKFVELSKDELDDFQGGDIGGGRIVESIKNYILNLFTGNNS